ncbi:hypothetical protein ACFW6K_07960 [Streptomyces sp. NPDC058733]|uniref:hypothetical protein n=1 Tax=unclassified Streptomyces TaxID=2593676 RepID=UPI00368EDDE9
MTAPSPTAGRPAASRPPAEARERPRYRTGTAALLVLVPVVLTACAWLAQGQGTLPLLTGAFLALLVLVVAWAMCGAGPGAFVAVLGFALSMFWGPAMNDYVLDHRGVRHDAVVTDTGTYYSKHGDGRTCTVVPTDTARHPAYDIDAAQGCTEGLRRGSRVTLVVDPEGWLAPRLDSEVTGVAPYLTWTSAGLFAGMEAFILYGRLRRRRRP